MPKAPNDSFLKTYNNTEWLLLKLSLCLVWVDLISKLAINNTTVPYPSGICSVINCTPFLIPHVQYILLVAAIICSIMYLMEKYMVAITLSMFLISLVGFTLEESNGILMRSGLYTTVFFAQAIAYYRCNTDLHKERIQFPIQIIAAGYFLASISKLNESGLYWVAEVPHAALQMFKTYAYYYYDSGNINELNKGLSMAEFALAHPFIVKGLFGFSLVLESMAWLAVISKKHAFIYGLFLAAMHLGIFYFMHILVAAVFYPMLIFFVNPFYWLFVFGKRLVNRS